MSDRALLCIAVAFAWQIVPHRWLNTHYLPWLRVAAGQVIEVGGGGIHGQGGIAELIELWAIELILTPHSGDCARGSEGIMAQLHESKCSLVSDPPIDLTLIIPAYNEADRLPSTLDYVLNYLQNSSFAWELIVADDGSEDATPLIVAGTAALDPRIHHLRLAHQGKAAAVRAAVSVSRGQFIIFTDADLSTPIENVDPAIRLLQRGCNIVIGTREGAESRRIGEPIYRHVMGRVFNRIVQALVLPGINDTQCGFKAFRAEVARGLFHRSLLYRDGTAPVRGPLVTGFDIELLFLARKHQNRIYELPVVWSHVEGSNVRPLVDTLRLLRDATQVRLNDLLGRYSE